MLKVGDYVRTPLGITKYIGKYDNYDGFYEFDKLDDELWTGDIANIVFSCEINNIVLKSSPNIIDLIEVGDYVNGVRVDVKGKKCVIFYDGDGDIEIFEDEIKSIVTRESMESVTYYVK